MKVMAGLAFSLFMANTAVSETGSETTWGDLAAAAGTRMVSLILPDGALLEGTIAKVNSQDLILLIRSSSDSTYRRGQQVAVPRAAIKVVQARVTKGLWRAIVSAMGAAAGAIGGWALAEGVFHASGEGQGIWRESKGALCLFGAGAGGAAAGYMVGSKLDRDILILNIID